MSNDGTNEVCDICGSTTSTRLYRIEGAEVNACYNCGRFGAPVSLPSNTKNTKNSKFRGSTSSPRPAPRPARTSRIPATTSRPGQDDNVLIENSGRAIQQAREKLGLTRKELAEAIFIRETLLAHIEQEKISPDDSLVKKLERALEGLKLTGQREESSEVSQYQSKTTKQIRSLTLGDFAQIRKKKES